MFIKILAGIFVFLIVLNNFCECGPKELPKPKAFLDRINEKWEVLQQKNTLLRWTFHSNVSRSTLDKYMEKRNFTIKQLGDIWNEFVAYPTDNITEENFQVQLRYFKLELQRYADGGVVAYELEKAVQEMVLAGCADRYTLKKVRSDIPQRGASIIEKNSSALKDNFVKFVNVCNSHARMFKVRDCGDILIKQAGTSDFKLVAKRILEDIFPLYRELHAYIRFRLRRKFNISEKDPIPVNYFGDNWLHDWKGHADVLVPYPETEHIDLEETLSKQGYTAAGLFKTAEDFFVSLGFPEMSREFWTSSIFYPPREARGMMLVDDAVLISMRRKDVRVRNQYLVSQHLLFHAHFLIAKAMLLLTSAEQPPILQNEPLPGYYDAIANAILLQIRTANHLRKLSLINSKPDFPKEAINNLMFIALDTLAKIPLCYAMDNYLWSAFAGSIRPDYFNSEWWKLRFKYQGVEAETEVTDDDFDFNYDINKDDILMTVFYPMIMQFQVHKAMCIETGEYDFAGKNYLYNCDTYGSKDVGNLLRESLQTGRSKSVHIVNENLMGNANLNSEALLEYFKPLFEWLQKENRETNAYVGWE